MKRLFYFFAIIAVVMMVSCGKPKTINDLPSQYATLEDGTKVHYKTFGTGSISLVFVHGFGCDMNAWEKQYEAFDDDDAIRMIFVDLPGYGKSDKPETEYTLDYFASAVKTVIDSIGVKKVVLVGHSLGSPVCREFVFDYPASSVAFCDIDGVYCFYQGCSEKYLKEIDSFKDMFHGEACKDNITAFVESLAGPYTPDEITDYAMSTMPETPEYVASSTMKNLVDPKHWDGEMINIPSLIICTRNSGIDQDNQQQMSKLYNDFIYVELDNTGHFIQMEDADLVNNLIERCYERWRTTAKDMVK